MVLLFTSATEQDSGRKDTAQPLTRCQYQEGGLVQRDASAPFRNRTKQQQQHKRPTSLHTKQRSLSQLVQLVRTPDFPADQDPGHRRCGASIYHHFGVSLSFVLASLRRGLTDDWLEKKNPRSATMYMQEALEMVCRKRRLQPKEYVLLLSDMSILIPLDRTVASLQGESDLRLVKRSMLPHMNVDVRPIGRSTDPNGASPPFFFPSCLLPSVMQVCIALRCKHTLSSK
jgi:hypothetical protein